MRYIKTAVMAVLISSAAMPAVAEIKIAVVGPMTGANASFGDQLKAGAEAAADAINAAGGVLGQPVELVIADDVCDPRQAVSVANKLIADGISFVNGHFCSGATLPASEAYEESGVITITVSTSPEITERGLQNIFRIGGRDDQQGPAAADFILRKFKGRRIAILNDKSPFGAGLADQVRQRLTAEQMAVVFEAGINPGDKDYNAVVSRLKAENIEVVFFGGYHTEAGLLMRQAVDIGLNLNMVGGDPLASKEFVTIAGPAAEGANFTFGPDPSKNPQAAPIMSAMHEKNLQPDGWALYSYGTIQVFAEAISAAGSTDSAAVLSALHSRTFSTVLGDVTFDDKGDNKAPGFVVYEWHNGKSSYAEQ